MRLLEFQAKRLLAQCGVSTPESILVRSQEDLKDISSFPVLLKAQVPVGGRGKAGGIRIATQMKEASQIVEELLNANIKSYPIQAVLAEEKVETTKELYLSVLIDSLTGVPLIMTSSAGGADIEEVAKENPEKITQKHLNSCTYPSDYVIRYLAKYTKLENKLEDFKRIIRQVYNAFQKYEAQMVEINPLALTPDGFVALDAKILLDDKAAYRHRDLVEKLQGEQKQLAKTNKTNAEQLAEKRGITYVTLGGDIGMISDGAGTGMLTLDLIYDAGGQPANFCELGGLAGAESMEQALEVVNKNTQVKVILIGLIGGLTRMDDVAEGILNYLKQYRHSKPLIIRMCGTGEEIGKAKLNEAGIEPFVDLEMAVHMAVQQASKGTSWQS